MSEIWKDIKGYEGYYQVSSYGNVKSLNRRVEHKKNRTRNIIERILKSKPNGKGYYIVGLHRNGIMKHKTIHRLVCEAFIPNPLNKPCINHLDSNTTNNHVDNLEWVTYKENTQHGFKYGNMDIEFYKQLGKNTGKKVLMFSIRNDPLLLFDNQSIAQRMSGFDSRRISDCCNNKRESYKNYKWQYV